MGKDRERTRRRGEKAADNTPASEAEKKLAEWTDQQNQKAKRDKANLDQILRHLRSKAERIQSSQPEMTGAQIMAAEIVPLVRYVDGLELKVKNMRVALNQAAEWMDEADREMVNLRAQNDDMRARMMRGEVLRVLATPVEPEVEPEPEPTTEPQQPPATLEAEIQQELAIEEKSDPATAAESGASSSFTYDQLADFPYSD